MVLTASFLLLSLISYLLSSNYRADIKQDNSKNTTINRTSVMYSERWGSFRSQTLGYPKS